MITLQNEPYLLKEAKKLIKLTKNGHFFYESIEDTCNWIEKVYLNQLEIDTRRQTVR